MDNTYILTFNIFVDAEDLEEAIKKGKKMLDESDKIADLIGVRELEVY